MKQILLYKIHNDDNTFYYTREEQPFSNSEKYYRLEAEQNCFLQNILTKAKFKTIVVPEQELVFWVEKTYK